MQTQCPHCDTRFRVTETQVNTADGFVRCSICQEVFNAIEVAEQDDVQPSLLRQENIASESSAATENHLLDDTLIAHEINSPEISGRDEHSNDEPNNENSNPAENNGDNEITAYGMLDESANGSTCENAVEMDTGNNHQNISKDEFTTIDIGTDTSTINFNQTSTTDNSRKETFDFFDEEANESLSHVVPENLKESYASSSTVSNVLWGTGILLLSVTLFIEYVWFNRDQLNQIPQLQIWSEKLCQQFECTNISMRNPKKIELIARNVYSHPNEKNALMVNLTIKNHANYAQPYPVMQINFSDVRGGDVAARRFLPEEYLPVEIQQQNSSQQPLFEADTNMTFTLEIQDPGKQALTYEFNFL